MTATPRAALSQPRTCAVPWCVEHSTDPDLCFGPTLTIEDAPAGTVTLMHDPDAGTLIGIDTPAELSLTSAQALVTTLQAAISQGAAA